MPSLKGKKEGLEHQLKLWGLHRASNMEDLLSSALHLQPWVHASVGPLVTRKEPMTVYRCPQGRKMAFTSAFAGTTTRKTVFSTRVNRVQEWVIINGMNPTVSVTEEEHAPR